MFSFKTFSPTNTTSSTVAENIHFLHVMSDCDTTPAMFMHGKMKFSEIVMKDLHLADVVKLFKDSNANREIEAAGEHFLL